MLARVSALLEPPDALNPRSAEAEWITEGPNSGGIVGWWLYQGHMYRFHHEGSGGSIEHGIPVATWISTHGELHPAIVAVLKAGERAPD